MYQGVFIRGRDVEDVVEVRYHRGGWRSKEEKKERRRRQRDRERLTAGTGLNAGMRGLGADWSGILWRPEVIVFGLILGTKVKRLLP